MSALSRRPWAWAFAASCTVHMLALGLFAVVGSTGDRPARDGQPPAARQRPAPTPVALVGDRMKGSEPSTQPAQGVPGQPALVRGHGSTRLVKRHLAAESKEASPAREPQPVAPSSLPGPTNTDESPGGTFGGDTDLRGPAAGGNSAKQGGAAGEGAAKSIGKLHQRLAAAARHCYPPTARRMRLRGEVGLHFCLGEDGSASTKILRGSTGFVLLDRAALDCVLARALPAAGLPGCYDVQIRFSDDE